MRAVVEAFKALADAAPSSSLSNFFVLLDNAQAELDDTRHAESSVARNCALTKQSLVRLLVQDREALGYRHDGAGTVYNNIGCRGV